jgi:hypothetical protein
MAQISRIGSASADATTVTIPVGHQAGDLLLIYSFRAALTAPSLPAGWTSAATASSGATSYRIGWKIAGSAAETSGTWTSATGLVCFVYRGTATNKTPIGTPTTNSATSSNVIYTTLAINCPGTSWLAAFGVIVSTTSTIETAPTNLTNLTNLVGATVEYAGHDSNGVYNSGSWPATGVAVTASAEWRSAQVEIFAEQGVPNNYQSVKVGNGMSVGEKIR